jgi:hypothetical protein
VVPLGWQSQWMVSNWSGQVVACLLIEQGFAHGSVRAQGAGSLRRRGSSRVRHGEMCMWVNWTVGKKTRVVYRRRRDEALAQQLRVLFALSRCTELGPVHMQNCDSMISRKERQVFGKSAGFIFSTLYSSRSWLPKSTIQRCVESCL